MKKRPASHRPARPPQTGPTDWCNLSGHVVFVPVALSHAAHALCSAFAIARGYETIGAYFYALAKNDAGLLCSELGAEKDRLGDLFDPKNPPFEVRPAKQKN